MHAVALVKFMCFVQSGAEPLREVVTVNIPKITQISNSARKNTGRSAGSPARGACPAGPGKRAGAAPGGGRQTCGKRRRGLTFDRRAHGRHFNEEEQVMRRTVCF